MLIDFISLTLDVWTIVATLLRSSFIPFEAEPSEVLLQLQCILHPGSLRVKVLYAQKPGAAFALC